MKRASEEVMLFIGRRKKRKEGRKERKRESFQLQLKSHRGNL